MAVTGVSRSRDHGSNVVYTRLRDRGYEVFAVNPNADEVEGDPAYHSLSAIPGGVEAVVIGTRPEIAEETMRECAELGIEHVWMHRGPGAGSVSERATDVRPRAWHRRDRRRLPVHVRPHRRSRPQGDAPRLHAQRQRPKAGLTLWRSVMKRYEYKVIDTGKHVEEELNALGAQGWQVVGVTTKKQLMIAPPQAIVLMREVQPAANGRATAALAHARA